METVTAKTLAEMDAFAKRILGLLQGARQGERATLLALSGDLGAGKTAFAKSFAAALGVAEDVTSPTYVIEKVYALRDKPWKHLVHIDAYRLEGGHELLALGFEEMLRDPHNLILVEWPEKVPTALPQAPALSLAFRFVDESAREISFDAAALSKNHA